MYSKLLTEFEAALRKRDQRKADRLLPGLPPAKLDRLIRRHQVRGNTAAIRAVFGWKNGTRGEAYISEEEVSPLPLSRFFLPTLELMAADFSSFIEISNHDARYRELVGRYFPVLWNGATDYIAVDLISHPDNRVVVIKRDANSLIREAYPTFSSFLVDATAANEQDRSLVCFANA